MVGLVVGRAAELAAVEKLLERANTGAAALVLDGEAGIGKTTIWLGGIERGREAGYRVLSCRPAEAEASLPFVALGDLLEPALDDTGAALSGSQGAALEAAFGRIDPAEGLGQLTIARAALALLRALSAEQPLLLAVDDVQWLDAPTAAVLEFAARRIADSPVRLLIARRTDADLPPPLGLARALPAERVARATVGPLTPGELDSILRSSLDLRLPRPRLLELHRVTVGNPYYALEMARRGLPAEGEPLSVPETIAELVQRRLRALSEDAQAAVLLTVAASQPTSTMIERAAGHAAGLAEAVRAGVIEVHGERLRPAHPFLASIAYSSAPRWERREAHGRLAAVAPDAEQRAWHLALCTEDADETIAAELEAAAAAAAARAAPEAAAVLAEHSARLTPTGSDADVRRRTAVAAEHHIVSGDPARGRTLLERLLADMPAGPERAELLCRLADAVGDDLSESIRLCEQALAESGGDAALGAQIETALGIFTWIAGDLRRSAGHSREAARLAEEAGDELLVATALGEVCNAETVLGLGYQEEDMRRALELEGRLDDLPSFLRPSFQLGVISLYTDDLERARPLLEAELARVRAAGDESTHPGVLFRLADLELRAGNWAEAARLAKDALTLALQAGIEQEQGVMLMMHGLVQAHLGNADEAANAGESALALAEHAGDRVVAIRSLGALGFLELSLGRPDAALERLSPASDELRTLGVGELSISQVANNELEALVAAGRLDEAEAVIAWVEEKGRPTGRSWHGAIAGRGRALVASARGDVERARAHLRDALEAHERLPQPFELGRTLLVEGSIERRAKQRGAARASLTRALELFDSLGAPLWAEKAAAELARIPGRPPASGELSETQRRIAELVAEGRSNKEIAARLFVTVRTVESNLTRIYAALGVHSRTELASRFAARV